MRLARTVTVAPLALALLIGCGPADGDAGGGTVIVASAADADALIPPTRTTNVGRMISELLFDPLVEIGPDLNVFGDAGFAPRLARSWRWSVDSLTITFALDADARWHDGQPVVAADVIAGLAAVREPRNGSALLSDLTEIDSMHVVDDSTVSVHFHARSPEQMYTASLVHPLPSHLVDSIPAGTLASSAFAQAPVGSGQFRFVAREPKVRLELAAVENHYRGRPGPDRIALVVSDQPSTAIAKLWTEEADVFDVLPPPDVAEAAKYPHVRLVRSYSFDYSFIAFNFRDPRDTARAHPLLRDVRMRRAIALGVDAAGVRRAILDSLARPALGPFARAQFTSDTTLPAQAFDTSAANAQLDALGWDARDADGIRTRDGRTLALRALVPAPSANRVRASVLVQEQLRRIGVALTIDKLEGQAFGAARDAGDWDIVFGGWGTTPSPRGIRGTWVSRSRLGAGRLNSGNYSDRAFDTAVEAGLASMDPDEARRRFREAYEVINADVAAIWLYEPIPVVAVHERFILPAWRPEAWWRTLHAWRLSLDRRLPRDARPVAP